ncbi:MAG: hypothetical protein OXR66_03770 [Candidatus Woesearchaeota archaeon]|nr:hypothetical protein [Candidatus Woesearchaeota archaeon]
MTTADVALPSADAARSKGPVRRFLGSYVEEGCTVTLEQSGFFRRTNYTTIDHDGRQRTEQHQEPNIVDLLAVLAGGLGFFQRRAERGAERMQYTDRFRDDVLHANQY